MAGRTPPQPVDPGRLLARSTAVIGFWLVHIARDPARLAAAVTDILNLTADGSIRPVIGGTYPLDRAADAHRALLSRESVGKLVLDPQS
jgi:NADPH2:quinone reductase